MALFKRKAKQQEAPAPAAEPKSFVIIKNAPEPVDYMNDFAALNGVYAEMFGDTKPARSCVEVARLPKDVKVEIECIALA